MPSSGLDGKYSSGKKRGSLFRERRQFRLPISLIIIALIVLLFYFIPPANLNSDINLNSKNIVIPTGTPTNTPLPRPTDIHGGHIVFTCTRGDFNQLCMINADGTDYKQITNYNRNDYYPIFSPDGDSILYASNQNGSFDIYMLVLSNSKLFQLTNNIGNAFSPDFSPDGKSIVFLNKAGDGPASIWMMGRTGENPRLLYTGPNFIVGAKWSPKGDVIAFAMQVDQPNAYEIYLLNPYERDPKPKRITKGIQGITGSLDWSPDAKYLLICAGPVNGKEVYQLNVATGELLQLTHGGNNAAASYSPDGQYIVYNSLRNNFQADLFIMRSDGHSTRQLTDNPEPDWQPRWGP